MKIGLQNFQRMRVPFLGILIFVTVCSGTFPAMAKTPLFEAYKRIIVLDPGHGGREFGARGPDGTSEKAVTLALARLIAAELKRDFKVALTRTDDYHVDLANRTALANHLKAGVFISFHTGGSFVYSTTGAIVYYYQNVAESSSNMEQNPVFQDNDTNSPIEWDRVQNRYLKKSRTLARMINTRLNSMNSIQKSRIQGAPLVVLQGANMPAILLEVGYLTNPAEEKNLRDNRFLTNLAGEISKGIKDFLSQTNQ